jgi:putative transcriptional regulator
MTKAGARLIDSAREMREIAQGTAQPHSLYVPPEIDVKAIRRRLDLSQEGFAAEFGFSLSQIRDWEQGRTGPVRSDRAYLMLIGSDPNAVRRMLDAASAA